MLSGKPNPRRFFLPFFFFSLFFFIASLVHGAEVQFSWTPNSETNLAGYKIYYGTASRNYTEEIDVGNPGAVDNQIIYTLSGISPGITYYYASTAYDVDGFESDYSDEAVWTCPLETVPNNIPVAEDGAISTSEDNPKSGVLTATDADNDTLTYSIVNNGSMGTVIMTNAATGAYIYTPAVNSFGSDNFSFKVNDGTSDSNIATVSVDIEAINDAPVAYAATLSVNQNEEANGILSGSDIDSSQLTFSIVANGDSGFATIIDPALGTYTYTPTEGVYGEDEFQFAISDGIGESNQATVAVTIQQDAPVFAMEIGEVTVGDTWTFVAFTETFTDPVVVAKPASNNDPSPCVVRIRNLSSSGFEIRLQNYDYLADEHGMEQLGYVAVEQGSFILENGKRVEAGIFNTNLTDYSETKTFIESFPVMPVVATSIVTEVEYDALVSRVENITENGFDYRMQEQEENSALHTFEDVAYIAWEPFCGMIGDYAFEIAVHTEEISDQWLPLSFQQGFDNPPVLIAGMLSQYEQDTASLRHSELTATGVQVKVAEEQSLDSETDHAFETLGFVAISVIDLEGDADSDGLITAEERDLYGTSPGAVDTDEDGLDDGAEVIFWGIAWDSDADSDGLVNLLDPDSDNDGFLDGEEVELGFDPADSSSTPDADPVTTVITLAVDAAKIRGIRTVELFWSDADGDSVQIIRIRDSDAIVSVTVANENYHKEILKRSGTYTYQVCETDGSVCSDVITVKL
ncbi:MAG: tandem-95 repeat protein [Thermodesulfobacteriota bacterium]|nr:tandem-95 repeat protein [Thermodesulfobacteriota bacterium]